MAFLGHFFSLFVLLMIGSDFAAIAGEPARQLNLPGSAFATSTPAFIFFAYLLGVTSAKEHWGGRLALFLIVPLMLYPLLIFGAFSRSMVVLRPLSSLEMGRFKSTFAVSTVFRSEQASTQVIVAARDFRPEMSSWLEETSAKNPTTTDKE